MAQREREKQEKTMSSRENARARESQESGIAMHDSIDVESVIWYLVFWVVFHLHSEAELLLHHFGVGSRSGSRVEMWVGEKRDRDQKYLVRNDLRL